METTIQQLTQQEAAIQQGLDQVAAGKGQLESIQDQVNNGAMTLAQARGQLASGQLEAAVGIGEGTAQLAAGEAAIQMQEAQMESAQSQAAGSTDVSSILSADMVKTILAAENFSMPAGYVTEDGIDYLVRVGDKFKSIEDIKDLVLIDMEGIDPVKLSDVANVELVNNSDGQRPAGIRPVGGSSRHRGRNSPACSRRSSNPDAGSTDGIGTEPGGGKHGCKQHPVCGYGQDDSGRGELQHACGVCDGGWN